MAFRLPAWLRRGLEAALLAAAVAVVSLAGGGLSAATIIALPGGAPAGLLLAPSVLALGVLTAAYPVALAATRGDAILGALTAGLLAADAVVLLASGRLEVGTGGPVVPAGLLVALLAGGPFLVGLLAGQVGTPLGFGRRAGARSALVAAGGSLAVLVALGTLTSPAG